jgi:hypothetical protein
METFSVFIKKIGIDSAEAQAEFKCSLIETLCIDESEAEEIVQNIPGIVEADLGMPAAEALAEMLRSIGGIVEIKNSLEELQELDTCTSGVQANSAEIETDDHPSIEECTVETAVNPDDLSEDLTLSDVQEESSEENSANPSSDSSDTDSSDTDSSDTDTSDSNGEYDFDFAGLMLEDEDDNPDTSPTPTKMHVIPETDTPLDKVIKNDDESLLDLALAFEESQEKSSLKLPDKNVRQNKEEVLHKVTERSGKISSDTSLNLQLEDTPQIKPEPPKPKTGTKVHTSEEAKKHKEKPAFTLQNEVTTPDKKTIPAVEKSPSPPRPAVSNSQHSSANNADVSEIEDIEDTDACIIEKAELKLHGKPQYSALASGVILVICIMYFMLPGSPEQKDTSKISPEVVQQLLNAQKRDRTRESATADEVKAPKRKQFKSHISNEAWEMKTRVESVNGKMELLEVEFGVHMIPLPDPEEYISKQFIPRIATMGITFRSSGKKDSPTEKITIPSRIYTKIGTKRKRFTIPLTVEFNEAGKVLTIFSENNYEGMPPGTYSIDPTKENPDSVTARIYFIIPLKEKVINEIISDNNESEVTDKKK